MIGGTRHPDLHALRGRTVAEAARAQGETAGAMIVRILRLDQLRTSAFSLA